MSHFTWCFNRGLLLLLSVLLLRYTKYCLTSFGLLYTALFRALHSTKPRNKNYSKRVLLVSLVLVAPLKYEKLLRPLIIHWKSTLYEVYLVLDKNKSKKKTFKDYWFLSSINPFDWSAMCISRTNEALYECVGRGGKFKI